MGCCISTCVFVSRLSLLVTFKKLVPPLLDKQLFEVSVLIHYFRESEVETVLLGGVRNFRIWLKYPSKSKSRLKFDVSFLRGQVLKLPDDMILVRIWRLSIWLTFLLLRAT